MSHTENALFNYLMLNCDRLVSRGEILAAVWHIDSPRVVTRTVDMHISKLRKKLREGSGPSYVLRTVRSEGYMLCSGVGPLSKFQMPNFECQMKK